MSEELIFTGEDKLIILVYNDKKHLRNKWMFATICTPSAAVGGLSKKGAESWAIEVSWNAEWGSKKGKDNSGG